MNVPADEYVTALRHALHELADDVRKVMPAGSTNRDRLLALSTAMNVLMPQLRVELDSMGAVVASINFPDTGDIKAFSVAVRVNRWESP